MSVNFKALNISVLLIILSVSSSYCEEVYKWVDKDGAIHFSNNPSDVPQSGKKMILPDAPREYRNTQADQAGSSNSGSAAPYVSKYESRDNCRREVGIKHGRTMAEMNEIENRIFFLNNDIRMKERSCAAERKRWSMSDCQQKIFELRSELSRLNTEKDSKLDRLLALKQENEACNSITD